MLGIITRVYAILDTQCIHVGRKVRHKSFGRMFNSYATVAKNGAVIVLLARLACPFRGSSDAVFEER